jgi:hypothetical protein
MCCKTYFECRVVRTCSFGSKKWLEYHMFAQDVVIGKSHDIGLDCAMDWLDCLLGPHGTILNYCLIG